MTDNGASPFSLRDRKSKQWLLCSVLAMFKLFRCILVLAKPMIVAKTVPNARAMTTLTKEQRLELRESGSVLLRKGPLANRVAFAKRGSAKK